MPKPLNIAIFYSFLKLVGGAELMTMDIRDHYKTDLWVGAIDKKKFNEGKTDNFNQRLFNPSFKLKYLHTESRISHWYAIKRQLYFLFSPKIKELLTYDYIIFSGNIFFVPRRLRKLAKKEGKQIKFINYCNTPPRKLSDQKASFLKKYPKIIRWLISIIANFGIWQYTKDMQEMDLVIANSNNIQARIKKYLNLNTKVLWPPVHTDRFKYISTEDYYLSHSRLEETKRIPLIVKAFAKMPTKKLVICSSGPLKNWVTNYIQKHNLKNIEYLGFVSDATLENLVGRCLTGIMIAEDEDAGITQCELMAAGKPVIGVNEGGLAESIIDKHTGFLLPKDPTEEDLIKLVQKLDPEKVKKMSKACQKHAKQFDRKIFFQTFDKYIKSLN